MKIGAALGTKDSSGKLLFNFSVKGWNARNYLKYNRFGWFGRVEDDAEMFEKKPTGSERGTRKRSVGEEERAQQVAWARSSSVGEIYK